MFLSAFANAHGAQMEFETDEDGRTHHAREVIRLEKSRIDLLARIEHFRDQGEALHTIGQHLLIVDNGPDQAAKYLQKARDVGAAHGFFSVECRACVDLGKIAIQEGRQEEGLDLYRNALAAAPLVEADEGLYELNVLGPLVEALLTKGGGDALEEVAPLIPRFREAARAESRREVMANGCCHQELLSYTCSARLLELRGQPEEAAEEVRALLALVREHKAAVQAMAASVRGAVLYAVQVLESLETLVLEELFDLCKLLSCIS